MADHTLGTIRGTIEIDYDGAGIVRAVRDTEKAKKELGGFDGVSSKVLGAFGKLTKGFLVVGGAINTVAGSIHLLSGVIAGIAPLIGAGLAAAPAVILSFASAFAVAKIAVSGVGEALGAAAGPANLFNDAIKNLAPNAQQFARALQGAMPALKAAKKEIQNAFFEGTAGTLTKIINNLLKLTSTATEVARSMGLVAQNIAKTATSAKNIESIRTILMGVNGFLNNIKNAIGPVVTGFLGLAAQGAKFGSVLGSSVAKGLQTFGTWLSKLDLDAIFSKALPIIQSLGSFLKDVGTIAQSLFSIFIGEGGNAVGVIGNLVSEFAGFLQTAQGTALINSLRDALQSISTGAGQVFLALLQALTPAIIALLPGITQLANQLTSVLVPAINALAPLLLKLATFLSENMNWLGPVAGAVVALAAAYKTYAAAAKAVAAVQDVLKSKMVVSTAIWLRNTAAVVANRIAQAASAAVTGGAAVAAWVANTAAVVANRIATAAVAVAMGVVRVATIAWTAVQWALNVAMEANPIGLVVVAIAALVAGIIYAYKHSETFRAIVQAVWSAIKVAIKATVDWFVNVAWPWIKRVIDFIINYYKFLWKITVAVWTAIFNGIKAALTWIRDVAVAVWTAIVNDIRNKINFIRAVITTAVQIIRNVWTAVMNGVRAVTQAIWGWITGFIQKQINFVKSFVAGIRVIATYVRNAFNNAKNAASQIIGSLISLVRGIPGRITSALGNLAGLLYNKGRDIIRGFINGIASMFGAVRDKARSIVSAVTDFLPGSPAKEGPLSGKGYVLLRARRFMNDFAQGLNDGAQKPTAALMGAVNPLARAVVPTGSTTKSGASSAPTTQPVASGTRTYQIQIGDKRFADLVLDAMTGAPIAVSNAANEGDRQKKFAGSGRR